VSPAEGRAEGRAAGEALLAHPDHELYDPAGPLDIFAVEKFLGLQLPESYRGLLEIGSGGVLASGDLLLGTRDPEGFGATLAEVTRAMRAEGLPDTLLPIVDGERFFCLDLAAGDEVVEVDPEEHTVLRRCGRLPDFVRTELLRP
jgi:hypothetical protein